MTVTCTGGSPNYGTGCALLNAWDEDNDGTLTQDDWFRAAAAVGTTITPEEFYFIEQAYLLGTGGINLLCEGCYVPPAGEQECFIPR